MMNSREIDDQPELSESAANGMSGAKGGARKLAQFYAGKNVLITGATGFIGKVFLIKFMDSFPDCGQVYVVLRSKRGLTPQQRLNKMLQEEPFKSFENKVDWSKMRLIEGDMSAEDLGLFGEIKEEICEKVNIIFNMAASVRFDAPLKQNLRDNYKGARNMLQLAVKLKQLISLVHVSTFYANHHLSHIEERIVPLERDCEKTAELIDFIPDSISDSLEPHLLESRPNTYVITKAMAENLVLKYEGRLPIAVVRPSIVVPSARDPTPGWVDNVNGPMGLGTLGGLGILRNIDWNYWGVADLTPADYTVNCMLAVAERTARLNANIQEGNRNGPIVVYNCSSSSLNPITWGQGFEIMRETSLAAPPYKMLRYPVAVPKHKRANKFTFALTKLSELLFAYFLDFILVLCGQKRILTRLTAKLHHGYQVLLPFTTREFTCSNENLIAALEELHEEDKRDFPFDIRTLNWREFFVVAYHGSRKHLLKEDPSNIPAAIFKMRVLLVVDFLVRVLFYSLIGWLSYKLYLSCSSVTGARETVLNQ